MLEGKKNDNEPPVPEENNAGPGQQDEDRPIIHLSHDGLFKVAFDNKNLAESFARENLPAEITKDLDFSSMTQDKDTFIDQKLSRCFADVLFESSNWVAYRWIPPIPSKCYICDFSGSCL